MIGSLIVTIGLASKRYPAGSQKAVRERVDEAGGRLRSPTDAESLVRPVQQNGACRTLLDTP